MVREWYAHDRAIDLIYECYGCNCAFNKILMAMIRNKEDRAHPMLSNRQM